MSSMKERILQEIKRHGENPDETVLTVKRGERLTTVNATDLPDNIEKAEVIFMGKSVTMRFAPDAETPMSAQGVGVHSRLSAVLTEWAAYSTMYPLNQKIKTLFERGKRATTVTFEEALPGLVARLRKKFQDKDLKSLGTRDLRPGGFQDTVQKLLNFLSALT